MDKVTLLKTAIETVSDRGDEYGSVLINFSNIADRWSMHLKQTHGFNFDINPQDVAIMLLDAKLARLARSPDHRDSVVGIAGYAACYAELLSPPTKEEDDQ